MTHGSNLMDVLASNGSPTYCKQNVLKFVISESYIWMLIFLIQDSFLSQASK